MTESYKKKLIEVAIPLEAINAASAREKSIRHGHPSTLHLWWARRPLAACRAVLFAQLVDDPSSHPDRFPSEEAVERERKRLFTLIEELVKWENSSNEEVLERARAEIRASCDGELPPIYDPFSGGGSIPLEAQRLGLPAYGSDLNPVAVMIGKAMIEIPPKFKDMEPIHPGMKGRNHYRNAEGLAEDVKYYGEWMREKAWERIGHLYPQLELPKEHGGGKATVVAWIWARTVPSPDPAFSDVQVPISSSFLLSSRKGKEAWIEPVVDKQAKTIAYRIRNGGTKAEIESAKTGTKVGRGAQFRCLMSDTAITPDYVRACAEKETLSETLIAIVVEGNRTRLFLPPSPDQERLAFSMEPEWRPHAPMNTKSKDLVSGRGYGINDWAQLFSKRQTVALTTFSDLISEVRRKVTIDANRKNTSLEEKEGDLRRAGKDSYAEAIAIYLTMALNKVADRHSTIATWDSSSTKLQLRNTFARQSIPMTWDFGEGNVFGNSSGAWSPSIGWVAKAIAALPCSAAGSIRQENAMESKLSKGKVISTDPPYYDNIAYADLSDFLYIWLKKSLSSSLPEIFSVLATPKNDELVALPYRHCGREGAEVFFLSGMKKAIGKLAELSDGKFPATIY